MLAELLAKKGHALAFNIVEVGAVPLGNQVEPFQALLDVFPGSSLSAFELDPALCAELNTKAPPGVRYYASALGRTDEQRTLYETVYPLCTSLYEPDERYADVYQMLDVIEVRAAKIAPGITAKGTAPPTATAENAAP